MHRECYVKCKASAASPAGVITRREAQTNCTYLALYFSVKLWAWSFCSRKEKDVHAGFGSPSKGLQNERETVTEKYDSAKC